LGAYCGTCWLGKPFLSCRSFMLDSSPNDNLRNLIPEWWNCRNKEIVVPLYTCICQRGQMVGPHCLYTCAFPSFSNERNLRWREQSEQQKSINSADIRYFRLFHLCKRLRKPKEWILYVPQRTDKNQKFIKLYEIVHIFINTYPII
jgi:hypothetical protein